MSLPTPAFDDPKHHLRIYQGDCLDILAQIPPSSVDLIFADPPYSLSNGGITCRAGKMVPNLHDEAPRRHIPMTTQQAIKVVEEIILENRENGELEGILNRNRIAALNRLLRTAKASSESQETSNTES
jgi:DNA modification methylase